MIDGLSSYATKSGDQPGTKVSNTERHPTDLAKPCVLEPTNEYFAGVDEAMRRRLLLVPLG